MKGFLHVVVLGLMLLCSCRSSHYSVSETEFSIDSVAALLQYRRQISVSDSVWRHTELSFDSCFVIFDSVAQPNFSSSTREKGKLVRIYGAHLSSNQKKCVRTEENGEDTFSIARMYSFHKSHHSEKSATPPRFSSIKLSLSLIFLAVLAAFWWNRDA